jgi:hypothetical protein
MELVNPRDRKWLRSDLLTPNNVLLRRCLTAALFHGPAYRFRLGGAMNFLSVVMIYRVNT